MASIQPLGRAHCVGLECGARVRLRVNLAQVGQAAPTVNFALQQQENAHSVLLGMVLTQLLGHALFVSQEAHGAQEALLAQLAQMVLVA